MPTITLAPFADLKSKDQASAAALKPGAWVVNGERELEETTELRGWDYGTPLVLSREIVIDCDALQECCGLGHGAALCVTALWGSGGAYDAWEVAAGTRLTVTPGESRLIQLTFRVPSDHLAGVLKVATRVVLESHGRNPRGGAATELGNVLWEDASSLRLEGTAARVSVTTEDFRERFGEREAAAAWTVSFAPDWLHTHPSVGLQVVFNKLSETVIAAIRDQRPGPREKTIRSAVAFDVGRQMLARALADEEGFDDHSQFEKDTSGSAVQARLRTLFPGMSVSKVRAMYREEADRFERLLQSHHKLFAKSA
jgi:hypothetical protein